MIWPRILAAPVESRIQWQPFRLSLLAPVFPVSQLASPDTTEMGLTVFFLFPNSLTRSHCLLLAPFPLFADTFASKVAAQNDKYADSSIGNVTGSNAVNIFLGIGIAWTLAAFVNAYRGKPFRIDPGNLSYSVTLFCICAAICCMVLMIRRRFGGELGGPTLPKVLTAMLFVGLWLFYVLMSSLEAYGVVSA